MLSGSSVLRVVADEDDDESSIDSVLSHTACAPTGGAPNALVMPVHGMVAEGECIVDMGHDSLTLAAMSSDTPNKRIRDADRKRKSRALRTEEEIEEERNKQRARMRMKRAAMDDSTRAQEREKQRERMRMVRSSLSEDAKENDKLKQRERMRKHRETLGDEARVKDAERKRRFRAALTEEELEAMRAKQRDRMRKRRATMKGDDAVSVGDGEFHSHHAPQDDEQTQSTISLHESLLSADTALHALASDERARETPRRRGAQAERHTEGDHAEFALDSTSLPASGVMDLGQARLF